MGWKGFAAGWKRHLVLGFQAVVAGMAVGIISQMVLFVIVGVESWLLPGFLESIPSGVRTTISVAFIVLILLPLYGLLLRQMAGIGGVHKTLRGEVKDGKWRKRDAIQ